MSLYGKVGFFEVVTPLGRAGVLFARRNLVLALTALFLCQFGQTIVLRTHKIMFFPVISSFLPKSESKWGLSRANTTRCDKKGVTTSKNPTLYTCIISVYYFVGHRDCIFQGFFGLLSLLRVYATADCGEQISA
eukprot:sb/3474789/